MGGMLKYELRNFGGKNLFLEKFSIYSIICVDWFFITIVTVAKIQTFKVKN